MYKTALSIIKTLQDNGKEAYLAGGCVRDMLIKVEPKDYDIVTSAKPEEIENILSHTIPIGKQFGVILAVENGHHFEIATFRSDSGYADGRRPDAVIFSEAKQDAKRRDFTINALFYDPLNDKFFDYVGGQDDLKEKLIRFIGTPHKRIQEDHLRILRAVRFKNVLKFQYHPDTYQAIVAHVHLVNKVSKERVRDEINKMLMSENRVKALNDLEDTGLLKEILPEIQNMMGVAQPLKYHQEGDVYTHSLKALGSLPENSSLAVRWAVLLHDVGKPECFKLKERIRFDHHVEASELIARKILDRLKFSYELKEHICWLIKHHMMIVSFFKMTTTRKRHWFLHPWFKDLMMVFRADIAGTKPAGFGLFKNLKRIYKYALKKIPESPKKLLSGEEVMAKLNLKPGKKIGKILNEIRDKQLCGKIKTKEEAMSYLEKIILRKKSK